jgi:hypothetical protein
MALGNAKNIVVKGDTPTLDFQAGADTMAGNLISYKTIYFTIIFHLLTGIFLLT